MMKIKSFFVGLLLLILVFAMVVLTALIYRANERSTIKSYIFQMGNYDSQRVGELQDINDISANDLRNKLIKKYVSEYFKVIPGDTDVTNRPVLANLSVPRVFNKWKSDEAVNISKMSNKKMFRMVRISDDGIATLNNATNNTDSNNQTYYIVHYDTLTWTESNFLKTQPIQEQNAIVLEVRFEPGLREEINEEKLDIKKYLESGKNPVGLFKFQVTDTGSKALK